MTKPPITPGIIRYLRPMHRHYPTKRSAEIQLTYDNLGGVVFAITIDHVASELLVAWSICRSDDNFSKEFGRTQALKRLEEQKCVVLAYNPDKDLLSNIVDQVREKIALRIIGVSEENLRTLYEHVTELEYWLYAEPGPDPL